MPSPFPGMDPYLEDPVLWPGFHALFAAEVMVQLNADILPGYIANIEERVYISDDGDPGRRQIVPDIRITPTGRRNGRKGSLQPRAAEGGVAVCEPVDLLYDDEIHEQYVEIIERNSRRVVTVIEILSPTNKEPGSYGRKQYLAKRAETFASQTHWVEIDLLREGDPVVPREKMPPCDYSVLVAKVTKEGRGMKAWPIKIGQQLPPIPVPLLHPDPDVILDLQKTLNATYDRGSYSFKLDYRGEPLPALRSEPARWAGKLLKQKKLR